MIFPYGDGSITIPLQETERDLILSRAASLGYLGDEEAATPAAPQRRADGIGLIREALAAPIGSPALGELARGRCSAVVLISDMTRLCPSHLLLPPILDALNEGGIPDDRIRVIVALGTHRAQTDEELRRLTGAAYDRVRVENHSSLPEDNIRVGTTSFGTVVALNPAVVEADLRIATGNIEPHRLVGMSGGVKALFPGVASRDSIQQHHARSLTDRATPGDTDNSLYRELEEIARIVPVHFLCNVVVDPHRQPIAAFAGNPDAAHRRGIAFAKGCFLTPVPRKYDVVIASAGGSPKDMQLYQAIKSLENAAEFAKDGGAVLLIARCEERYGNAAFQEWTETHVDRERAIRHLSETFVLGAHKLAILDKVLRRVQAFLYSDLPPPISALLGFTPVGDPSGWVRERLRPETAVAAMPVASLTFPEPAE